MDQAVGILAIVFDEKAVAALEEIRLVIVAHVLEFLGTIITVDKGP